MSLRLAKKQRVEPPAAAFADPDDDVEPTLTLEEEDERVQKLKARGPYTYKCKVMFVPQVTPSSCNNVSPHRTKALRRRRAKTSRQPSDCGIWHSS